MAVEAFRLGVNYWPSETAMGWLADHDGAVVRRDLRRIAAAGMDTVRIFLRWEDVQPTATTLDRRAIAAVVDTADAASDAGVDLIVTLFTGHMSGTNWIPAWAAGGPDGDDRFRVVSDGRVAPASRGLRNWYVDDDLADAQAHLADGVASALADHDAVWAWDLGNENSNCTIPPDGAAADRWLERMTSVLRARDARPLVTVGTHMEDLEEDRRLGPAEAARWCDFVCMHGYPIYAEWAHGPSDPHLVPFLAEMTSWLAGGAPVLFAEFGLPTARPGEVPTGVLVDEGEAAAYTGRVLDGLRAGGAIGALVWCYADYRRELHDRPPLDLAVHERTFGLWRTDGTPKPAVAEVSARRSLARTAGPTARPWIDLDPDEFARDGRRHLARLYDRYPARRS